MKLLQIYNKYRSLFGGEETVMLQIADLVERHGGTSEILMKSSRGLDDSFFGKSKAFLSGIYNSKTPIEVMETVNEFEPDVVHVHNLYPLFSPSILPAIRRSGVPVVMTVHNHIHTCPRVDHLCRGVLCERCVGGREYNCVLRNCRESIPESVGYALRSATARKKRLFTANVSKAVALNEFAKGRLVMAGFAEDQVAVIPNMVDLSEEPIDASQGEFAVFSGRMSREKGVDVLRDAARLVPEIPVRLAGGGPELDRLQGASPENMCFLGQLDAVGVRDLYRSARFHVVPSVWFEGCPLVMLEAMSHGLPIIASRIGGLGEIVEDGVTGFLFEPGNGEDLAEKMRLLWNDPERCRTMGAAGRARAQKEFDESTFWRRLTRVYDDVMSAGS